MKLRTVRVAIGIPLVSLVVACSVGPLPSPALPPSGSPSVRPTAAASDAFDQSPSGPTVAWEETGAAMEVDTTIRHFAVETGGVRVSIEIDRNPVPAGEFSWVTTSVENIGPDAIHWITDGCEINAGVSGEFPLRWATGVEQPSSGFRPEDFAGFTFKDWALNVGPGPGTSLPIIMDFTPEAFVGRDDIGCADIGIRQDLAPGEHVSQRARWDGQAAFGFGPAPSGPAEIRASFRHWWRDREDEGARADIEIRLPIEVVAGRDPRFLSPGQAIDVALRVPAFRQLLNRYPRVRDWIGPVVVEVDQSGRWNVGLEGSDGSSVTVLIDPINASVVDVPEVP